MEKDASAHSKKQKRARQHQASYEADMVSKGKPPAAPSGRHAELTGRSHAIGDAAAVSKVNTSSRLKELAGHTTEVSPSKRQRAMKRLERMRTSSAARKAARAERMSANAAIGSAAKPAAKPAAAAASKVPGFFAKHPRAGKAGLIGGGSVLAAIAAKKAHSHFSGKSKRAGIDLEALAQQYLDSLE
jgi:hypothetical protein